MGGIDPKSLPKRSRSDLAEAEVAATPPTSTPQSAVACSSAAPASAAQKPQEEQLAIRPRGMTRFEVRAYRPREGPERLLGTALPQTPQLLRISAGRAAAAAGIHPYADVGEVFVEFVYQDMPEMLLRDAALAGVEIVAPALERARLLEKSGEAAAVEKALGASKQAMSLAAVQGAKEAIRVLMAVAKESGRLSPEEADELRDTLDFEVNCEFGARHEDAALAAFAAKVGRPVYGDQRRVSIPLPHEGPEHALGTVFPMPHTKCLSALDAEASALAASKDGAPEAVAADTGRVPAGGVDGAPKSEPLFRLTGFIDGMVDLPRCTAKGARGNEPGDQTAVVEMKHRMGKIKNPPEIYDIVQLGSYCRALGCSRGVLVQCLRENATSSHVGVLHVHPVDFSEGSHDRTGWDRHVLPGLYSMARAVYAARQDVELRLRLLTAADAASRTALVREVCAHLH